MEADKLREAMDRVLIWEGSPLRLLIEAGGCYPKIGKGESGYFICITLGKIILLFLSFFIFNLAVFHLGLSR